ncbi:hypothetical protein FWK35_00007453 [Aphis craccivora]|uniref:Uncharacterized protein n=1 Tax=Aphis craccivora TaxID=307492 RepID=A0A6G0YXL6_APHCR|nr:hypothetical protein FWK35_00007453 [Aphis craccivora]
MCHIVALHNIVKSIEINSHSERSDECIDFTMMCSSKSSVRKIPKKVTEKWEFSRKTSFRPNRFLYMVVNQKLITD